MPLTVIRVNHSGTLPVQQEGVDSGGGVCPLAARDAASIVRKEVTSVEGTYYSRGQRQRCTLPKKHICPCRAA